MKKVLLSLLVAVFALASTNVMAQETKSEKLRWKGHETNKFWDNWEISAGFGSSYLDVNTKVQDGGDPGKFFDRNSWNANFAVTKWFVPIVGMRLQLDGGQYQNYSNNPSVYGGDLFQTPYVFVHGDVLVNLSNWIGGYREDRVYYAIPYVGFGYTAMTWTKDSIKSYDGEFATTVGLLNKFRVCKQLDIQLDLRTWVLPEEGLAKEIREGNNGVYACTFSASVGVAYRFNKRDWNRAYTQSDIDGYIAVVDDLNNKLNDANNKLGDANNKINDLDGENDNLRKELEECKNAKVVEEVAPETVVFFNIDKSNLTGYTKATLESYIALVKDTNAKLTVTGYADKETGNPTWNERLSKERAENVKAFLVENGVAEDRITVEWKGDTVKAFEDPHAPKTNRCVVIK